MKPLARLAAGALAALGLAACQPAAIDDASFNARVKNYLLKHPEDLRAALENMQAKDDAEQEKALAAADLKAKAALPTLRAALERDPRDFVANPNGKVTVTEFYDYRCPHCISVAPYIVSLVRSHPEVRFVFKEMPIFGATSEHASRAAMAAKAQGKDYVGLYEAFMAAHPLTDDEIDRLAAGKGINLAAMNSPVALARDQTHLDDVHKLADELAIDGTPGFIVGDTIIHGEDRQGLADAIARAEGKA